jgi:hypothetical protein
VRWLEAAGVKVPRRADGSPDCTIELSALTQLDPKAALPASITRGARVSL